MNGFRIASGLLDYLVVLVGGLVFCWAVLIFLQAVGFIPASFAFVVVSSSAPFVFFFYAVAIFLWCYCYLGSNMHRVKVGVEHKEERDFG